MQEIMKLILNMIIVLIEIIYKGSKSLYKEVKERFNNTGDYTNV